MNREIKTKQNSLSSSGLNEMCVVDNKMQASAVGNVTEPLKVGQTTEESNIAAERTSVDNSSSKWLAKNYATLKIDESEGYFIVRTANECERYLLTADDFQAFLLSQAPKVRQLTLNPLMDVEIFQNLQVLKCTLRYKRIEEVLQPKILENLNHLERLELKEINMECGAGLIDKQIVENLEKLRNLKHLNLDYFFAAKIEYKYFLKLILGMELESLEGNLELEPPTMELLRVENKEIHLRKLQIASSLDKSKWLENLSGFLNVFTTLTHLQLKIIGGMASEEDLSTLASACVNLKNLQFNGTTFENLNKFPLPPAVQEIHLKWCRGLTQANLRQILSENNLHEFSSSNTKFEGNFQNFQISSSLHTLKIDRLDMCDFHGAYADNQNLQHLTWYHCRHCSLERSAANKPRITSPPSQASCLESEELEDLDYNETSNGVISVTQLISCPNLTTLDMGYKNQMSLDILLRLQHLRKLNTWIMDTTTRQWSYIIGLLKHPSLEELTLSFVRTINETSYTAPFVTNVTHIKLQDFNFNDNWLAFFLELFAENRKLKLQFYVPPLAFVKPLRSLINHRKFPRDLQTIEIYGFTVDCNELRSNFYPTMKKVKYVEPMNYVSLFRV
uniref:Leucine Rich repeat protein n=1 Tax=Musca domestica TaxID=7370 RepID=A0A1I8M7V1_MUSDO